MYGIVGACFPKTMIPLDRFHHQQFCLEALQEVRREYRREQMTRNANAREEHRPRMKKLTENDGFWIDDEGIVQSVWKMMRQGQELLVRSKGLLMMSPGKCTDMQRACGDIVPGVPRHQDRLLAYSLPEDDILTEIH